MKFLLAMVAGFTQALFFAEPKALLCQNKPKTSLCQKYK